MYPFFYENVEHCLLPYGFVQMSKFLFMFVFILINSNWCLYDKVLSLGSREHANQSLTLLLVIHLLCCGWIWNVSVGSKEISGCLCFDQNGKMKSTCYSWTISAYFSYVNINPDLSELSLATSEICYPS